MDTPESGPVTRQMNDTARSPLYLLEQVIDIFGWVVKFVLLISLVVITLYSTLHVALLIYPLARPSATPPSPPAQTLAAIQAVFDQLNPLVVEFWSFLKPVLQLVMIAVVLRWLLLPQPGQLSEGWRNLLADTPVAIAILAIGAMALIVLLGVSLPSSLTNVVVVVLVLVLVRALLFSPQAPWYAQVRQLSLDVPAVILLLVIGTISLITLLGQNIPETLANVALVMLGFYFGQVWMRRPSQTAPQSEAAPPEALGGEE